MSQQRSSLQTGRAFSGQKRHGLKALCLSALVFAAVPAPAHACPGTIYSSAYTSAASQGGLTVAAGIAITNAFNKLYQALGMYGNGQNTDGQNMNNTAAVLADREVATHSANAVAQVRAGVLMPQYKPSRVTCSLVSAQDRLGKTRGDYITKASAMGAAATAYGMNAKSGPTANGSLATMNNNWKEYCTKYANPETLGALPEGVACPGPSDASLRDLHITPWKAFIDPIVITDPKKQEAASDAVKMLTDVQARDSLRGAALARSAGQTNHVMVARDVTRMNLARAVLNDAVAMRMPSASAGGISRLAGLLESVTGQKFDPAANSLADQASVVAAAKDTLNGTQQNISARLATQQALLFEVMRVSEMIMAVDSVELAIRLEQSKGSMSNVSASMKPN